MPLIYIDNLIDAVVRCASTEAAIGKAFTLVDDGSVTVLDYLHRFIEETRLPAKIVRVPYMLSYGAMAAYELAAGLGLAKKGVTSRLQLSSKHKSLHYSNDRAKRELGWSCKVPIDDALTRAFQWYIQTRR